MPKTLFKPGVSGNPAGRPKGAVDQRWKSLDFWFSLVMSDDWDKLLPVERVKVGMDGFKALLARKQMGPASPEESKESADAAMNVLRLMENAIQSNPNFGTNQSGNKTGLENGQAHLQTETPAE